MATVAVTYTTSSIINAASVAPNNVATGGAAVSKPLVRYAAQSQRPLLGRCGDYMAAALRVQSVGQTLPVFIPRIQVGQSNPTKTIYNVSVSWVYTGGLGPSSAVYQDTEYVTFVPDITYAPVADAPLQKQDITSEYYYIYSYSSFCTMINAALSVAFIQVKNLAIANGISAGWTFPLRSPVIERVPGGFSIGLYNTYYAPNGTLAQAYGQWFVTFNDALFALFNGFPAGSVLPTAGSLPPDVYHTLLLPATALAPEDGAAPDVLNTEFDCTDAWSPVMLVQVASATLPAVFESTFNPVFVGAQTAFEAGTGGLTGAAVSGATANIVVSFGFGLAAGAADLTQKLTYTPSGERKWVELVGDQPLTDLTWSLLWVDSINGETHPMTFQTGGWAELELVYQHTAAA